jgi:Protein of unknown function (DUF4232)
VRNHDRARRGLQGRATSDPDPSRRPGYATIRQGRFASASGRPAGRRTGGRPRALGAALLAVASIVAGRQTEQSSALTPAVIPATVRPAVRTAAFIRVGSAIAERAELSPASPSRLSASRAQVHRACVTSALRLSRAAGTVAAGTSYTWYTLTSIGPAVCSMVGYPGVAILDAHGRVVQHPAVWSTHPGTMPPEPVRRIVLATGQQARFVLASTDVTPSPGCRAPYAGNTMQVYPPNQTAPFREPYRGRFCNLIVGPLQPPRRQRACYFRLALKAAATPITPALTRSRSGRRLGRHVCNGE